MMEDLFSNYAAEQHKRPLTHARAGMPFRILALNVQNAGADRYGWISDYIAKIGAEVLVISELKEKKPTFEFLERLAFLGYGNAVLTPSGRGAFHVLIACSLNGKALAVETETLRTRVAVTRIEICGGTPLYLVGLYAPTFNDRNVFVRKQFFRDLDERVFRRLCTQKQNVLVMGDFNLVEAAYHDHLPEFVRESRDHLKMLVRRGFVDIVRLIYPDQPKYTWVSPRTGHGQRLDHVFATHAIASWVEELEMDDSFRTSRISDHSAVQVKISPLHSATA